MFNKFQQTINRHIEKPKFDSKTWNQVLVKTILNQILLNSREFGSLPFKMEGQQK